jgi:hypothetical protein
VNLHLKTARIVPGLSICGMGGSKHTLL